MQDELKNLKMGSGMRDDTQYDKCFLEPNIDGVRTEMYLVPMHVCYKLEKKRRATPLTRRNHSTKKNTEVVVKNITFTKI